MHQINEDLRELHRVLGKIYFSALGARGGSAGKGAAKRRSPEHYAKMAEARRKNALRKRS